MTTGEGTIEIAAQAFLEDFFVDTFVPGTSIGYPIKWTDEPREGVYDARVEIDYEGRVAEWTGSFTVGNPVLADLEDRGVDVPGGFPILPVGAAAAGAALAAATRFMLQRRRHAIPAPVRGWPPAPTARPPVPPIQSPTYPPTPAPGTTRPLASPTPRSAPPPPPPPPR